MLVTRCTPMLIPANVLAATGVVAIGLPVAALACTAMTAPVMAGVHGERR